MKKTLAFAILASLIAVAGCTNKTYPAKAFFLKPFPNTESERVSFKQIFETKETPSDKGYTILSKGQLLGFIEETTNKIAGTTSPKTIFYLYDKEIKKIGFMLSDGATFTYETDGYAKQIGVYHRNDGVKILLGFPGKIQYEGFDELWLD